MGELSDAVAVSNEVTIKGQRFQLSPITFRDFADLEAWLERQPLEQVMASLAGLELEDRRFLLGLAYDDLRLGKTAVSLNDKEAVARCFGSVRTMCRMLWLSLRKSKPDLTCDQVADLVALEDVEGLMAQLGKMSGIEKNPTKASQTPSVVTGS